MNDPTPKVSIVVPVYNSNRYLNECLDSILHQTYNEFELILVDDGSTDDSGQICEQYALKDSRIRVIHQCNSGSNQARWKGVQESRGEWLTFVDSDDTILRDCIETLMSYTNETTDVVIGKFDGRKLPSKMTLDDYRNCCIAGKIIHSGPVARLFRTSLFDAFVFDMPREIVMGEDYIMNVRYSFATSKAPTFVDKRIYNYRLVNSSIMHVNVHTVEHAERFVQEVIRSIPETFVESYIYAVNFLRWRSISLIVYDTPDNNSWKSSKLYKEFRDDIREGKYAMTLSQRMALWPQNRWQLRIINKIRGMLP